MQSVLTVFSVANLDLQRRPSDRQEINIRSPYRKIGRPPKVIFGKWRGLRHRVRDPRRANLWTLPIGRGFQSGSCLSPPLNILAGAQTMQCDKAPESSGDLHARRGSPTKQSRFAMWGNFPSTTRACFDFKAVISA